MKTKIKLPLYIILLVVTLGFDGLAYAENPIPSQFTDRALLAKAKWTDMTFVKSIAGSWDKYNGTQDLQVKEILNTTKIGIYGVTFDVQMRRYFSDGTFEFVFVDKDSFLRDFRQQFLTYAIKTWGEPIKNIDYSLRNKEESFDDYETEWLLGDTHIRFNFSGSQIGDKWVPLFCVLFITKKGEYPLLKDLIALKCEGQRRLTGFKDSGIVQISPFVVIVDLNHNRLRRRDRSTLGKITQASDDYFVAEWQDKNIKSNFTIDRKLGTYKWESTSLESEKNYGAVNWGSCEKTNLQMEPKF